MSYLHISLVLIWLLTFLCGRGTVSPNFGASSLSSVSYKHLLFFLSFIILASPLSLLQFPHFVHVAEAAPACLLTNETTEHTLSNCDISLSSATRTISADWSFRYGTVTSAFFVITQPSGEPSPTPLSVEFMHSKLTNVFFSVESLPEGSHLNVINCTVAESGVTRSTCWGNMAAFFAFSTTSSFSGSSFRIEDSTVNFLSSTAIQMLLISFCSSPSERSLFSVMRNTLLFATSAGSIPTGNMVGLVGIQESSPALQSSTSFTISCNKVTISNRVNEAKFFHVSGGLRIATGVKLSVSYNTVTLSGGVFTSALLIEDSSTTTISIIGNTFRSAPVTTVSAFGGIESTSGAVPLVWIMNNSFTGYNARLIVASSTGTMNQESSFFCNTLYSADLSSTPVLYKSPSLTPLGTDYVKYSTTCPSFHEILNYNEVCLPIVAEPHTATPSLAISDSFYFLNRSQSHVKNLTHTQSDSRQVEVTHSANTSLSKSIAANETVSMELIDTFTVTQDQSFSDASNLSVSLLVLDSTSATLTRSFVPFPSRTAQLSNSLSMPESTQTQSSRINSTTSEYETSPSVYSRSLRTEIDRTSSQDRTASLDLTSSLAKVNATVSSVANASPSISDDHHRSALSITNIASPTIIQVVAPIPSTYPPQQTLVRGSCPSAQISWAEFVPPTANQSSPIIVTTEYEKFASVKSVNTITDDMVRAGLLVAIIDLDNESDWLTPFINFDVVTAGGGIAEPRSFPKAVDVSQIKCVVYHGVPRQARCRFPESPSYHLTGGEYMTASVRSKSVTRPCDSTSDSFVATPAQTFISAGSRDSSVESSSIATTAATSIATAVVILFAEGSPIEIQTMITLLASDCSSSADRLGVAIVKYFISPFADFPFPVWVFGNVGLSLALAFLHLMVTLLVFLLVPSLGLLGRANDTKGGRRNRAYHRVFSPQSSSVDVIGHNSPATEVLSNIGIQIDKFQKSDSDNEAEMVDRVNDEGSRSYRNDTVEEGKLGDDWDELPNGLGGYKRKHHLKSFLSSKAAKMLAYEDGSHSKEVHSPKIPHQASRSSVAKVGEGPTVMGRVKQTCLGYLRSCTHDGLTAEERDSDETQPSIARFQFIQACAITRFPGLSLTIAQVLYIGVAIGTFASMVPSGDGSSDSLDTEGLRATAAAIGSIYLVSVPLLYVYILAFVVRSHSIDGWAGYQFYSWGASVPKYPGRDTSNEPVLSQEIRELHNVPQSHLGTVPSNSLKTSRQRSIYDTYFASENNATSQHRHHNTSSYQSRMRSNVAAYPTPQPFLPSHTPEAIQLIVAGLPTGFGVQSGLRWLLPEGRWMPPLAVNRFYGVLGPMKAKSQYWALLPLAVGLGFAAVYFATPAVMFCENVFVASAMLCLLICIATLLVRPQRITACSIVTSLCYVVLCGISCLQIVLVRESGDEPTINRAKTALTFVLISLTIFRNCYVIFVSILERKAARYRQRLLVAIAAEDTLSFEEEQKRLASEESLCEAESGGDTTTIDVPSSPALRMSSHEAGLLSFATENIESPQLAFSPIDGFSQRAASPKSMAGSPKPTKGFSNFHSPITMSSPHNHLRVTINRHHHSSSNRDHFSNASGSSPSFPCNDNTAGVVAFYSPARAEAPSPCYLNASQGQVGSHVSPKVRRRYKAPEAYPIESPSSTAADDNAACSFSAVQSPQLGHSAKEAVTVAALYSPLGRDPQQQECNPFALNSGSQRFSSSHQPNIPSRKNNYTSKDRCPEQHLAGSNRRFSELYLSSASSPLVHLPCVNVQNIGHKSEFVSSDSVAHASQTSPLVVLSQKQSTIVIANATDSRLQNDSSDIHALFSCPRPGPHDDATTVERHNESSVSVYRPVAPVVVDEEEQIQGEEPLASTYPESRLAMVSGSALGDSCPEEPTS